MLQRQRWKGLRGRAATGTRDGGWSLRLATLFFLSVGGLGACGGSEGGGTTGPPPPAPPPAEPAVVCAESTADSFKGRWQVQTSPVEGGIGRIQFLDSTTGRALRGTRRGTLTLLTTSDGGSTWCADEITADRSRDMGHFLEFLDPDTGFTGGQHCTLLMTEDGGASWTDRRFCDSSHWFLRMTVIDSRRIWIGGDVGVLFRSENGGLSWEEVTVPGLSQSPASPVTGFAFFSREVGVFVESLAGDVFRTTDGGETWERHPSPANQLLFNAARVNETTAVAVGRRGTIVRTTDRGENWQTVDSGSDMDLWNVDFGTDGFGVAVGDGATILVSSDEGATWAAEESPVLADLGGASVLDADHAWVSGDQATILVRRAQ